MSIIDRLLNRTPEMQELQLMANPKAEYGTFGQEDKPRVTFEALAGIKNKIGDKINGFYDNLIGVARTEETPVVNADGTVQAGLAKTERSGFIPDLISGFKENATEKFAPSNLAPVDGKGLAFKIGEGLGTATRFLDSPTGRGLAVAGLVGALGGSGGDALAYGLGTTAQNQGLRMQDRIYRNDLKQHEINSLMASPEFALMDADAKKAALAAVEEKYNNMGGYITGNAYKNILASRQMQENAEWRKANLMADLKQNEVLNDIRRQELAVKREQIEANKDKVDKKELAKARQAYSTANMINKALETVKDNPDAFGFSKGVLPSDAVDRLDPKGTKSRAIINSVTAEYRKYLTGAQMSDKERKYYEKFLPNPRDNAQTTEQKLKGMLMVISAREGIDTEEVGTIITNNAQPKTNDLPATPKKIGKYTVEVQ